MYDLVSLGKNAQKASVTLKKLNTAVKNAALISIAQKLRDEKSSILDANRLDVANAKASGIKAAMIDRLTLNSGRIDAIADAILDVAALPDPIGAVDSGVTRPNGIRILKTRVPIGVIG